MLDEVYYWMIYHFKKIGTTELTEFNAYLLVCVLLFANFGTLLIIIAYLLEIDLKTSRQNALFLGYGFGLIVMIINYFTLFSRRKEIKEKYDQFSKGRRVKGFICFWLYTTLSVSLLFFAGVNLTR